ncbi:MAG: amino acid-binding protein [Candidatus Thermoplasmatota archaeon]
MWQALMDHFRRYPAQERVVRLLIQNGLRIEGETVYSGTVAVADTALARAADVDRRIVRATVETINQDAELQRAFSRFAPTLHLKDVAPELGCGVIQIIPTNATQPGILAGVSSVISEAGISIRQAVVDDPAFTDAPRLFVVTEERVPPSLIPAIQKVPGVKAVTIY